MEPTDSNIDYGLDKRLNAGLAMFCHTKRPGPMVLFSIQYPIVNIYLQYRCPTNNYQVVWTTWLAVECMMLTVRVSGVQKRGNATGGQLLPQLSDPDLAMRTTIIGWCMHSWLDMLFRVCTLCTRPSGLSYTFLRFFKPLRLFWPTSDGFSRLRCQIISTGGVV